MSSDKKLIIFSAPSGAGKTTIVRHLLDTFDTLAFSISATTRAPRKGEVDGKDYYFLSVPEFLNRVDEGEFLEYEQVYRGTWYGTLKSEVERLWKLGKVVLFDVDVIGGLNIKRFYRDKAVAVFVKAPSVNELRHRLQRRETESVETLETRVNKAVQEMQYEKEFDIVLVNDDLASTFTEAENIVNDVLSS